MAPRKASDRSTEGDKGTEIISKSEFEEFKTTQEELMAAQIKQMAAQEEQMSALREMMKALLDRTSQPPTRVQTDVAESSRSNRREGKEPFEEEPNEKEETEGAEPKPWALAEDPDRGTLEMKDLGAGLEDLQGHQITEEVLIKTDPRSDSRFRKLELPIFNGDNVNEWIFKAERYFRVNGLLRQEELIAATMCLEDKAFKWYAWYDKMQPFTSWPQLKSAIIERFQGMDSMDAHVRFFSLNQAKSVMEYREKFEELAGALDDISPQALMANFVRGLKKEIQDAVKIQQPNNLHQAMYLAQLVEGRGTHSTGHSGLPRNGPGTMFQSRQPYPQMNQRPVTRAFTQRPNEYRPAMNDRRPPPNPPRNNPSYKCKEPWAPGHVCTERAFRAIENSGPVEEYNEEAQVSLNSVAGLTSAQTMKLRGQIKGRDVMVLIDSGATHNFISPKVVREEGLHTSNQRQFKVTLGTGLTHQSQGLCPKVHLKLGDCNISADFLPLPLGSTDVILGMQWLQTLGVMKVHWRRLTMEFTHQGRKIKLQGDPALKASESSLRAIIRGKKTISECYLVEVHEIEAKADSKVPDSVQKIIEGYADVFEEPKGLPPQRGHEHAIVLKEGASPISVRPYRYPHIQKDEMEKMVNEMLHARIIRPSTSPYSSPVLLVKKKDGGWRFCVDYRALNKQTVPDKFPIPVIDELLDELHGSSIFSKIDLKSGYHQIRMAEGDEHKTAFRTHEGQYEFLVMPFGLTNAPATFQALMNEIFKPWLRKFVLVFFDDILIYSKSEEEHGQHIRIVLEELQRHQLAANFKKCQFGQKEVEYLGHIISQEGVSADQLKVRAMSDWPIPKNIKQLRGFLGLTGYYRKFVMNYGKIAQPLTELLKKDAFVWTDKALEAFEALKDAMTKAPVLALPDFSRPFVIDTDASGTGLGAVLMQDGRPIAYWSQVLSPRNRLKSVYERELMAIALAVTKWRPYLLGRKFIVRTDQKSLKYFLEQRVLTEEHQTWLKKILGYDFEIQYKPGLENKAADALSRKAEELNSVQLELGGISRQQVLDWEVLNRENQSPLLMRNREAIEQGDTRYSLVNNRLFYKGRFVLPKGSEQITRLFSEFHGSTIGGHSGVTKTYKRIAAEFYWEGMKKDVQRLVSECEECQRSKYIALAPAGLLQPLPIPTQVWSEISMDFIEGLPKVDDYSTIMVVVDRLSKYAHFIAVRHPYTATTIAELFIKEIVRLHGIPEAIVSDRDAIFISHFWTQLFKALGTSLKRSSAYHPQTDGQTEVVNRSLGTYLRCFAASKPRGWLKYLPWAEYWYNTSHHSSSKTTPYKVLYGRDPPKIIPYESGTIPVQQVEKALTDRDQILQDLKENLAKARREMKAKADQHRRDAQFKVGDFVYVKMQPGRQLSLIRKDNPKLAYKYYGPYEVEAKIGEVSYRLILPKESQVHPIFHVSQLKPASGPPKDPRQVHAMKWYHGLQNVYQPEALRGVRQGPQGKEVLIKWTKMPEHDATWESAENIAATFPPFDLEDKIALWGGGPDASPPDPQHAQRPTSNVSTKTNQRPPAHKPSQGPPSHKSPHQGQPPRPPIKEARGIPPNQGIKGHSPKSRNQGALP